MSNVFTEIRDIITGQKAIRQQLAAVQAQVAVLDKRAAEFATGQGLILVLLKQIVTAVTPPPAVTGWLTFTVDGSEETIEFKEGVTMTTVKVKSSGTVSLRLEDADGFAARADGAPKWESSNPSVGEVVPAEDGFSAKIRFLTPGTTQIGAKPDVDLGPEEKILLVLGDFEVLPGEAVTGVMDFVPDPDTVS